MGYSLGSSGFPRGPLVGACWGRHLTWATDLEVHQVNLKVLQTCKVGDGGACKLLKSFAGGIGWLITAIWRLMLTGIFVMMASAAGESLSLGTLWA